jgi:cytochrome c-type protein NapB
MKQLKIVFGLLLVCLWMISGSTAADVSSLRGNVAVPTTDTSAVWHRYVNDKENLERDFAQQPPLVPHENDRYTINLNENKCLDCHMRRGEEEAKSVEMSQDHFVNRLGQQLDRPSGGRHFCTQCHVPQVEAQPLIGSTFQSAGLQAP